MRLISLLGLALFISGCTLAPREAAEEKRRLDAAGAPYSARLEDRQWPELPENATWREILRRAFLANGDLEVAYHEWAAAVARIDIAAAYPNTNLSLGFEYMFSDERMKSWDRTTITAGPDAMQNLSFPTKVIKAGRVATADAQSSGRRFEAAKFDLQKRVLTAWLDYALMAERVRIQEANVSLLKLVQETAASRVRAGGMQQDLLKADVELRMADDELKTMRSELPQMRSMLNGMLGRAADAPLEPPAVLPEPRPLAADDRRLLEVGVSDSPELAALARQVSARQDALELARMQFIPDINPVAGLTGNVERSVGAMLTVPMAIPMIQGSIREARAILNASEAMARQTRLDRAAQFVAVLYSLRNSERQVSLLQDQILPASERVFQNSRQAYAAGSVGFVELIDSQRTLLDVRLLVAQARIAREKRIAELESLAGVDIETVRPTAATRQWLWNDAGLML